ncbi:MAG: hypothetical protein RLZZ574_717 [Cyanobacteriota bacterium]
MDSQLRVRRSEVLLHRFLLSRFNAEVRSLIERAIALLKLVEESNLMLATVKDWGQVEGSDLVTIENEIALRTRSLNNTMFRPYDQTLI